MNHRPVSFPHWKEVLASAALSPSDKAAYTREILCFLKHCKSTHAAATVEVAKRYLDWREKQGCGPAREALRWFYRLGQPGGGSARSEGAAVGLSRVGAPVRARSDIPPRAADDLGASPWERDLIKAIRERGFLWRTEQTYRAWAVRFARFLAPRSPSAASGEEVAAFLSALAVEGRASPAAQKQALNALVFLMQEALHRELGKMELRRAFPRRRLPTVLSVGETQSLFAQMEGTSRLMAELAYGAGLRLLELLRLRVHHVDLERQRLQVYAGKGDKDRITVLPEKLVPELRGHIARLRRQWEADQAAAMPGVWLPEGLAKKYPKAGNSWAWQWLFPTRTPALDPSSASSAGTTSATPGSNAC